MSRLEGLKKSVEDMPDTLLKADMKYLINRVEELEKDCTLLINKNNIHVDFANEYYANYQFEKAETNYLKRQNKHCKQALEEIAKETGTPYSDIAIKALAGDNS